MAIKRWIKWIVITVVTIVVLFFAVVATALALVDTQALRGVIEDRVETTTGRELRIEGPLDVSLFPWLGFELGRIRLANAEGFGDDPIAAFKQAQLRVRLLPLIGGDIALDRVVLNGLEVNLARNARGENNWDDLIGQAAAGAEKPQPGSADEGGASGAGWSLRVEGVEVRDARVTWSDASTGQQVTVRDFRLLTGRLEAGVATPVELSLTAMTADAPELELAAAGDLSWHPDGPRVRIAGLGVDVDARGGTLPGGQLAAGLDGDISIDAGRGEAKIDNLVITALDRLRVTGQVEGAFGDAGPSLDGRLAVDSFNPRELASALAIELPPLTDGKALTRAELKLALAGTPSAIRLDSIEGRIDDTRVTGSARAALMEVPRVAVDLEADRIDLDRYMPPSTGGAAGGGGAGADGAAADPVATLPVERLRGISARFHAGIGTVLYQGLDMSAVRLDARIEEGILYLDHAGLETAGGRIETSGRLDGRTDEPGLRLDTGIVGVQAEPLLTALIGSAPITGRLDTELSVNTRGGTLDAWTRALGGRFDVTFREGAVRGLNIAQRIREASARLSGGDVDTAKAERRTDFSILQMSGRIRDGVVSSDQLDLRSPLLRVSGAGEADLGKRTVDYTTRVLITSTLAGEGGSSADELGGLRVPLRIKGPWASPGIDLQFGKALEGRVSADAEAEAKKRQEAAAAELEKKKAAAEADAERKKRQQEEKLDRKKREAEDDLKKELEGLFD